MLKQPLHQLKQRPGIRMLQGVQAQPAAARRTAGAVPVAVRALRRALKRTAAAKRKRLPPATLARLQPSNLHQVCLQVFCRARSSAGNAAVGNLYLVGLQEFDCIGKAAAQQPAPGGPVHVLQITQLGVATTNPGRRALAAT